MKLKNKQTGKVQTMDFAVISDDYHRDGELCKLKSHIFIFRSIKQLIDEYEDYEPTEPLIKDEKIRKAVRAWAEANEIKPQAVIEFDAIEHRLIWVNTVIEFNDIKALLDLDEIYYSIPELCGEDEE